MAEQTTTSSLPPWLEDYSKDIIGRAIQLSKQDYQPYTGQRVADFTQDQQTAFDTARGGIGAWQPFYQEAADVGRTSYGMDPSRFQQFFNPYQAQVVNEIGRLGTERLTEDMLPAVNTTFTGAGQFGSSRHADFTNRALRDSQREIAAAQGQALASGFDSQMGRYQTDQGRRLSGAQFLANQGTNTQRATGTDVDRMLGIGGLQQALNQTNMDVAYGDYSRQWQFPYQQVAYANDIMSGAPAASQSITSVDQEDPSLMNQILGGGIAAFGAAKQFGWF